MKKINIFGKDVEKKEELKKKLLEKGFEYSEENPNLVICYGGDGIFLIAERVFPEVPKILIRGSKISNCGVDCTIEEILEKYERKEYEIQKLKKLKAIYKGEFETRSLIGVNDIVIRNSLPTEAIRFRIKINEKEFEKEFIGDGIVISTPYGSTKGAYFYSITQKSFQEGIGIAFNNITEKQEQKILGAEGKIEITITRGPGILVVDNNRDFINLEKGDRIIVEKISDFAQRIILN